MKAFRISFYWMALLLIPFMACNEQAKEPEESFEYFLRKFSAKDIPVQVSHTKIDEIWRGRTDTLSHGEVQAFLAQPVKKNDDPSATMTFELGENEKIISWSKTRLNENVWMLFCVRFMYLKEEMLGDYETMLLFTVNNEGKPISYVTLVSQDEFTYQDAMFSGKQRFSTSYLDTEFSPDKTYDPATDTPPQPVPVITDYEIDDTGYIKKR